MKKQHDSCFNCVALKYDVCGLPYCLLQYSIKCTHTLTESNTKSIWTAITPMRTCEKPLAKHDYITLKCNKNKGNTL